MKFRLAAALAGAGIALTAGAIVAQSPAIAAEAVVRAPAPKFDPAQTGASATAMFAGGCFWGVQGVYSHVKGVTSVVSGYTGGAANTAQYERVGQGDTGHAESVRITYDPKVVSYGKLLQIYFSVVADPTQLNRQGPDSGTQYRSAIFPTSDAQRQVAAAYIKQLGAAKLWPAPIVTRIEPAKGFFPAEGYHQDYLHLHPDAAYIAINDIPKVEGLKKLYPAMWRDQPVLVNAKG